MTKQFGNVSFLIENPKALTILFYLEDSSRDNKVSITKIKKAFGLPKITKEIVQKLAEKKMILQDNKEYYISDFGIDALESLGSI